MSAIESEIEYPSERQSERGAPRRLSDVSPLVIMEQRTQLARRVEQIVAELDRVLRHAWYECRLMPESIAVHQSAFARLLRLERAVRHAAALDEYGRGMLSRRLTRAADVRQMLFRSTVTLTWVPIVADDDICDDACVHLSAAGRHDVRMWVRLSAARFRIGERTLIRRDVTPPSDLVLLRSASDTLRLPVTRVEHVEITEIDDLDVLSPPMYRVRCLSDAHEMYVAESTLCALGTAASQMYAG